MVYANPVFTRPEPCKFAYLPRETSLTIKEFDIIKLSAQFSSVYGRYFRSELKKSSEVKKTLFQPYFKFLNSNDKRHCFFVRLALGYGRVLLHSRKLLSPEE
ncbi:hypothetical protein V5N11_018084 [Cardamine amara subsp. amara]|uniref:SURP motif domain-containing protein n=1 Tax=Cardamine amara subsp. amara TaxID=228776 RepID=A0ABD1AGV0_CARAN